MKREAYWAHTLVVLLLILKLIGFGFSWLWLIVPVLLKGIESLLPHLLENGKSKLAENKRDQKRPLTVQATRS